MIRVAGMTPLTTIDFPGRLAAVLFLQGCPWRCSYCHNPELLPARGARGLDWDAVQDFLGRRRGLLDGVVFSGGEPTSQARLPDAIARVKAMGFQVGLHTGGMYPARLQRLLPLLDWVGLDIKGPAAHHDAITGRRGSAVPVELSLGHLLESGVAFECRTTWHSDLFPTQALYQLAEQLAARGVRHWVLQECHEPGRRRHRGDPADLARLGSHFQHFTFRGG